MKKNCALLIVDVQNDFCPDGKLAVPEGDAIVPVLNRYISIFSRNKWPIFASRDWHPKQTAHFNKFGGQWPEHCIQDSAGAKFHSVLRLPENAIILSKGMDPDKDSYSAFQAVDSRGNVFPHLLNSYSINELFVGGLATDYCVRWSVVDALKFGFKVTLLADAIKGIDLKPKDSEAAIEEMVSLGAKKMTFEKFSRMLAEERQ
jgi:nicotinamidase/pyrazinamidase